MKISSLNTIALALIASTMLSSPVFAQTADQTAVPPTAAPSTPYDPGHPRINEVEQRLDNQENKTEAELKAGQISAGQAAYDLKQDQHVQNQLNNDKTKGYITKAQQRHMNEEENHDLQTDRNQVNGVKHPRVDQVDDRANYQERQARMAEKNDKITQAQEKRDIRADQRIEREARRDKMENGGHITGAEQRQLNRQENAEHRRVMHQEREDKRKTND